jgi:NAD+ kinase
MVSSLTRSGINVTVVKAADLTGIDTSGFDIVLTAGGDGTFLRAAQSTSSETPLLGVNTDPSLSQGSLTCCRLDMTGGRHPEFDRIIDRLRRGEFRWMHHDRLVVKIVNAEGLETVLPQYVLNEVLLAVRDPAKPSVFDIGIDDLEREKVRCSGLVVCKYTHPASP